MTAWQSPIIHIGLIAYCAGYSAAALGLGAGHSTSVLLLSNAGVHLGVAQLSSTCTLRLLLLLLLSLLLLLPHHRWDSLQEQVSIVLIGKYTGLSDAYLSVLKALQHACMAAGLKLHLTWVEAQYLEPDAKQEQPEKYEESWKQV